MCVHVCVQEGKRGRWCQEGHEHVCVTEGACLGERGKSVALHDSQPEPGLWSKAWQGISLWLPAEPPPGYPQCNLHLTSSTRCSQALPRPSL